MSEIELQVCDLLDLSKLCALEYNVPELSDRVLVFNVMKDGWEMNEISLTTSGESNVNEGSSRSPTLDIEHSDEAQSLKSEPEHPQVSEPEEETARNEAASSESETKHEPGSVTDEENQDDSTEKPSSETTSDNNDDDDNVSRSSTENTAESSSNPLRKHNIFVHSFWLAVQSKYFRSLLYSGMKESHCKEVNMKISECEEQAHLTLVEAIYKTEVLNEASVDELLAVLELADKYGLKFVFRKCKYNLQKNATTFEISKKIMRIIKVKHTMEDVEDLAGTLQKVIANEFSPLDQKWQTESFTSLSEPSVRYLLSSSDLITQSENTVFHALMHWMERNDVDPSSLEPTSKLLATVRFQLVTMDFLYNVIRSHPIACKMPLFKELYFDGVTYHAFPSEQKKLLREKPVERKKAEDDIVSHKFTLQKADIKEGDQESEVFWCCGYKMRLDLNIKSCTQSTLKVQASLNILELNSESFLSLHWHLRKKDVRSYGSNTKSFTFARCQYSDDFSFTVYASNEVQDVLELEVIVKPSI